MAVTSNAKEVEALLDVWHEAGARIVRGGSRAGQASNTIKVYAPNGVSIVTVHTTAGRRALLNTIADGRKAGLPAYPGDPHVKTKEQTMSTAAPQIDLPSYILDKNSRAADSRIADIRGAIALLGDQPVEVHRIHAILRAHGRGFASAANGTRGIGSSLYRMGYRPVSERKNGRGMTYTWTLSEAPEEGLTTQANQFPDTAVRVQMDEPDERMVTHHANDGHDHGEEPTVEVLGDQVTLTMRTVDEPEEEAAVWQAEAERLEAELVEAKRQWEDADAAFQRRGEQLHEANQKRESVEYTLKHEIDLQHEQIEALRKQLLTSEEARKAQAETLRKQPVDDGWQTLDIDMLREQRDGYTLDELKVDAAVFQLEVRIQRR